MLMYCVYEVWGSGVGIEAEGNTVILYDDGLPMNMLDVGRRGRGDISLLFFFCLFSFSVFSPFSITTKVVLRGTSWCVQLKS